MGNARFATHPSPVPRKFPPPWKKVRAASPKNATISPTVKAPTALLKNVVPNNWRKIVTRTVKKRGHRESPKNPKIDRRPDQ
jgi:hypothetical protein